MDHSAFASFHSSRLVRLLSGINDTDIKSSQTNFAEKFGQMLHFSNAITLSNAVEKASAPGFNPSAITGDEIRNSFLSAQAELVRFIATGFIPSSRRTDGCLPTAESLHAHCELTGVFVTKNVKKPKKLAAVFEPYRKFYVSRQTDLEIKVQLLRSDIRDAISGFSPPLAKLAQIDLALFKSLSGATDESFRAIQKLLGKRFSHLFDALQGKFPESPEISDFKQWVKPGSWLSAFCIEMQALLLAELEVRLQPVAGMIEALPQPDLS